MTREEYIRTKAKLASIDDALSEGHLMPEERAELEALSVALSKQLVTPWIPAGLVRRGMMLTLCAVGVCGLVAELYVLVWSFPLIAIFSPRIVGEHFHSLARHDRKSLTDSSPSMGA
jgi:hypothetical protein